MSSGGKFPLKPTCSKWQSMINHFTQTTSTYYVCVCVCHPPIYVSGTNWKRQLRYDNFAISWVGYIPQVGRVFHPTTQRQSLNFNQKVALESPKRTQHVSALPLNPKTRMAFKGLNIAGSVTRHDSCQRKANVETGGV